MHESKSILCNTHSSYIYVAVVQHLVHLLVGATTGKGKGMQP